MKRIGIIGAGVGGLATAIYLRAGGCNVTVFEKNEGVGGKLSRLRADGFTFDLGPTVLTMPFVLRSLFEHCGRRMEDYLRIDPVEPTCRYHWSDGATFDAFSRGERLSAELRRAFPGDADAAERFLDDIAQLYEATRDVFLFNSFAGAREFLRPANARLLPMLPRLGVGTTVHRSLSRRFQSARLVQFFSRFATYNGSSPYQAPATLNVIPHVELAYRAWYPRGGMAAVVDALARLAGELGVEIHTGAQVRAVHRAGRSVTELEVNNTAYAFDAVVSNVDALWTYRNLLVPAGVPMPRSVARAERSCSGYLMLLGVRGTHPQLEHHNIFFSDDYPDEFTDIFQRRRLPGAMTIYLSIASRADSSLAPDGCECWYVLMNAPASGIDHRDPEAAAGFERAVLARLASFGLAPEILWRGGLRPADIETRYNSADGAIYGASSNSPFAAFLRPKNRAPYLRNFYFAGGSTHPGGGVPLVILSGSIVARMILAGR